MVTEVAYDDDTECQRTYPLLMPKVEPMSLLWDDTEVLKKVKIIVPGVSLKKGTKQSSAISILAEQKLEPKRRSVLDCDIPH